MDPKTRNRALVLILTMIAVTVASTRTKASQSAMCGGQTIVVPFDDVLPSNVFFCSIAEAFFSGLSNGTTSSTYSPSANVPREQMAAFVTRTMDQSLKRGSLRAALGQNWAPQTANNLGLTTVNSSPQLVMSDGADLWLSASGVVDRVRSSDGKLLEVWTGATGASGVLCAMGKVFVAAATSPGQLYQIDPRLPAAGVTVVSSALGNGAYSITFDGQRIWTANYIATGSVSIITLNPLTVTNVSTGFSTPIGVVFDGTNIWVADDIAGTVDKLRKVDSSGAVLMSADVGNNPQPPVFDGTNIWVPNAVSNDITIVRAGGSLAGTVLATLSGNGLNNPLAAAFDGERILVTNSLGNSVSLWKASDFTPIGTLSTGASTSPYGACSDGLNFWITLSSTGKVARF